MTTAELPSRTDVAAVLDRIGAGVAERRESLAQLLAAEAGKPLALARAEIDRAVFVFRPRFSLVLTKDRGGWEIAAFHNTLEAAPGPRR